ncbi:MAG: hypothetical protein ACT4PL_06660, partial [Phycisphaerales bacterium]
MYTETGHSPDPSSIARPLHPALIAISELFMPTARRSRAACTLAFIAGFALATLTHAQDSVSTGNGLPGDAVGAYTIGANSEQVNNYVVDLTTRSSSWGRAYRFGPVAKSSQVGSTFFNHLIAAQAVSNRFTTGPFLRSSYGAWILPGQGVSATQNTTPTDNGTGRYGILSTTGRTGTQFALAFNEFGGGPNGLFGDADDESGLITAVVNIDPADPARLFVSRINTAVNKPSNTAGNTATASFGLGGVDASGTLHLLADGYALVSGSAVSDKRLIRINPLLRNTASLNQINNTGGTDATAGLNRTLRQGQTSQTTPALIPASVAARPVMIGADFIGNFLFEQTANTIISTTTTAHLPIGGTARGPMSYTAGNFARVGNGASDAGTLLVLSRASGQSRTRGVSIWGVNVDGSIDSATRIELPSASGQIVDPTDGFDPATAAGFSTIGSQEFCNYASQVSFRGSSGPVAGVILPGGDLLVAATCAGTGIASSSPASMDNYIAVGRVSAATGVVAWSVAAHTGSTTAGTGKILLGDFGADGTPGSADAGEGDGQIDTGPSAFIG